MQRGKSKNSRFKKAHWSQNQKLQAVSTYLMLGNMSQTAIVTGIPLQTLKIWKYTDWFKEYCLQLQSEDIQQMDSNVKRVIDKALKTVEERLDLGDAQFDQKTGEIVRVPVKAHVALRITTDLMTRRDKEKQNPVKEEIERTIDDRLIKLSEEFAKFANMNSKTIKDESNIVDVKMAEIVT